MTRYLTVEQVMDLAESTLGAPPALRDVGLLDSALHRPQASMFGHEAYGHVLIKAAALLHSLTIHRPFTRGDKQVAWVCTVVFLAYNGIEIDTDDDSVVDLVSAVASGEFAEVDEIAQVLWGFVAPA
ncbi:type II toxin-antitoxin system death-on-curing family toxin [Sphaerisporangium perillae]|uniref:type II toxin-antitoxin system death-on-curing family toxin n=1 Tax=Sphaerisporangium perillae TaxID=2935860 RepID=UPI00200E77D8|nr:Fic family protein [Sphaerisporangium perillae]